MKNLFLLFLCQFLTIVAADGECKRNDPSCSEKTIAEGDTPNSDSNQEFKCDFLKNIETSKITSEETGNTEFDKAFVFKDLKEESDTEAIRNELQSALQKMVELEHATLPLYLTGHISLDMNKSALAGINIMDVALEEMDHMHLAANLLLSIGGTPKTMDNVPKWPGHLPYGVFPDYEFNIGPLSSHQLDQYIIVEHPADGQFEHTIGNAYTNVWNLFEVLYDKLGKNETAVFSGDFNRQTKPYVTNMLQARNAICQIVDQGEGASAGKNPYIDGVKGEVAHYWRFREIREGHLIGGFDKETGEVFFNSTAIEYTTYNCSVRNKNQILNDEKGLSGIEKDQFKEYVTNIKKCNNDYREILVALDEYFGSVVNATGPQLAKAIHHMYDLINCADNAAKNPLNFTVTPEGEPKYNCLIPSFEIDYIA